MSSLTKTIGKDSFFLVGEIGGSREDAIWTRDRTGLDAALGLTDVQRFMVDAVKGTGNPANYFDLFRNSIEVDKPYPHIGPATTWSPVSTTTTLSAWVQTLRRGSRPTRTGVHWNWPSSGLKCNHTRDSLHLLHGSEQRFDGKFPTAVTPQPNSNDKADRYIREAMFGAGFRFIPKPRQALL